MTIYAIKCSDSKPFTDGIYLHGKLEELNGFDLCLADPKPDNEYGVAMCDVIIDDKTYQGKFYYWHNSIDRLRGLVVALDDTEAIEYASLSFEERLEYI